MKENISKIKGCYGCGVCVASCPKKIISMGLDENGFYEPAVNNEIDCIECGLCLGVCSYIDKNLAIVPHPLKSWAAWSNDEDIRRKCSSGGIGFEIGKQLIERGYQAVGCRYDTTEQRAEHYIATTIEEFIQSIGSKYIQSYTVEAFKQIDRKKQKYFVTGTPCQIDSFRRMIQKFHCEDNFVLMDFFCHGVPSMYAWKSYLKMLEPHIGKITYASWRNKFEYGWHDSWLMSLDGEKTERPFDKHESYRNLIKEKKGFIQSRMSQGDLFYKLFLGNLCLGTQCLKQCKYKYGSSSADLRIGDLWGKTYKEEEKGVSAITAFTDKGLSVIESLKNITLIEHPFAVIAEGQMRENAHAKELSPLVMFMLRKQVPLDSYLFASVLFSQRVITKIKSYL